MAFKVFLDANILLDFTLNRDNSEQARRVVALAVEGGYSGFYYTFCCPYSWTLLIEGVR